MDFFSILSLFGGLALFLYGMSTLGSGLEKLSGGRLESTLEKLTNNILKSVLLGAAVTAAVQSSSATTVIVVGLVNAGILKLRQAIGVIMGANIGTTVTAHILRLSDIDSSNFFLMLFKPTSLAPLAAVIGIGLFLFSKRNAQKDIGQILLGFGVLFTGMFNMEAAVRPLSEIPQFRAVFASFTNPVLGVLAGAVVTAVIQSSSASVGILQALSATGALTCGAAFPIIMGQNIGTCVTPLLASIGASRNAKRTAFVHLIFNVLGTAAFLAVTYTWYYLAGFPFWDDPITKGGIANFHTLFNVAVTICFIPFSGLLEKLVTALVKPTQDEKRQDASVMILDNRLMVSPGLAVEQGKNSVEQMAAFARENLQICTGLFYKFDQRQVERLKENELSIDRIEDRLRVYLLTLSERELTEAESKQISQLLHMMSEFERIGDYSVNLYECAEQLYQSGNPLSAAAQKEFQTITSAVSEILSMAEEVFHTNDENQAVNIEPLEQIVDLLQEVLKSRHIERLKQGKCSVDVAIPFIDALGHLERIADHCSNIGVYIIGYQDNISDFDRHEYTRRIHRGETRQYADKYQFYEEKYLDKLRPSAMDM